MASASWLGYCEDIEFVLRHLLRNGAIICEKAIQLAVQRKGIFNLKALAKFGADLQRNGKLALLRAARVDNYQAVEWLLQRGTSVFSEFTRKHDSLTLVGALVTTDIERWRAEGRIYEPNAYRFSIAAVNIAMIRFLLNKGAHLKLHSLDPSPFRLFCPGDTCWPTTDVSELMFDYPTEMAKISESEWQIFYGTWAGAILENGQMLETLKAQHRGFDVGFVLASAILMTRARHESKEPPQLSIEGGITQLLDESVNIDLYSRRGGMVTPLQAAASICDNQLVQALLSRGANVNAPASELGGCTAIAAICAYESCSTHEARRRISLIQLLLNNGADMYAGNTDVDSGAEPVLNILARKGDLEAATVLLEHGADPNRAEWIFDDNEIVGLSALDESTQHGRLDMTHLLLKGGGLSAEPGDTGYLGAIKGIRSAAIIELIQKHEQHRENEFAEFPELRQKHQAMVDQQARRQAEAMRKWREWREWRAKQGQNDPEGTMS